MELDEAKEYCRSQGLSLPTGKDVSIFNDASAADLSYWATNFSLDPLFWGVEANENGDYFLFCPKMPRLGISDLYFSLVPTYAATSMELGVACVERRDN